MNNNSLKVVQTHILQLKTTGFSGVVAPPLCAHLYTQEPHLSAALYLVLGMRLVRADRHFAILFRLRSSHQVHLLCPVYLPRWSSWLTSMIPSSWPGSRDDAGFSSSNPRITAAGTGPRLGLEPRSRRINLVDNQMEGGTSVTRTPTINTRRMDVLLV